MKLYTILLISLCGLYLNAQDTLEGRVLTKNGNDTIPLIGASIYWMNSDTGTVSHEDGKFSLPYLNTNEKLIISYLGYKPDTLSLDNNRFLTRFLEEITVGALDEITLTQRRKAIQKSYFEAQNVVTVNSAELLKAACCNLSESFETNPSIDVNFSDALTGTKQIRMLGLTSPYLLITEENIPMVRGASQAYGLSFTPGTWIESIQITKGTGSVVNGFESIAGQINTEIKKPFSDVPLFF